jgi:hypothetical protein
MFGRTQIVALLKERGANTRARNRFGMSAGLLGFLSRLLLLFFKKRSPAAFTAAKGAR